MKWRQENLLHYNMALVGGFFGCYAVLLLFETFASSQTMNLISIVQHLFFGDFWTVLLRVIWMLLYLCGLVLSVLVPRFLKGAAQPLSVLIDAAALVTMALLPESLPPLVSIFPIAFAMAYQWPVFDRIEGRSSSTIFSTNNFRQFVTALTAYCIDKEPAMRDKARVFGFTLVYYHIGVVFCCAVGIPLGRVSAFFGLIPLLPALALLIAGSIRKK